MSEPKIAGEFMEFKRNNYPKCPHCRQFSLETWNWAGAEDESTIKVNCTSCKKSFICLIHINYTFTSYKFSTFEPNTKKPKEKP